MSIDGLLDLYAGVFPAVFFWGVLVAVAGLEAARPQKRPRVAPGDRIVVNLALGAMGFAVQLLPLMTAAGIASLAANRQWGVLHQIELAPGCKIIAGFLLLDLLGYALHRLSHANAWLWRLHRIHHTDPQIDLSTLLRTHPAAVPVTVAFEGAAIVALGLHPLAVLIHGSAKLITMALGHAAVRPWPGFSTRCAVLFVTPAFHQRHHSAWQPETDSNYGEVLTIWDRLFGTASSPRKPVTRYGLGPAFDAQSGLLAAQLKLPFQRD